MVVPISPKVEVTITISPKVEVTITISPKVEVAIPHPPRVTVTIPIFLRWRCPSPFVLGMAMATSILSGGLLNEVEVTIPHFFWCGQ